MAPSRHSTTFNTYLSGATLLLFISVCVFIASLPVDANGQGPPAHLYGVDIKRSSNDDLLGWGIEDLSPIASQSLGIPLKRQSTRPGRSSPCRWKLCGAFNGYYNGRFLKK